MLVHPLHMVVLIIGVLCGLRHVDVGQRSGEQFPAVEAGDFARWKLLAGGAYRLGMSASFGKVLLDFFFAFLFQAHPPPAPIRWGVGLSLDVGWVVLMIVVFVRVRTAHKLARTLGIERAPVNQG